MLISKADGAYCKPYIGRQTTDHSSVQTKELSDTRKYMLLIMCFWTLFCGHHESARRLCDPPDTYYLYCAEIFIDDRVSFSTQNSIYPPEKDITLFSVV